MFVDMPLAQLRAYLPDRPEPDDFDAFWRSTLAEAAGHPLDPVFTPVPSHLASAELFDVTFRGYGGHPVKGWLLLPVHGPARVPCVVEYQGYGGGRGLPVDWLLWPSFGYAVLAMDSRGQGAAGWRRGDTPDPHPGTGPQTPGVMTAGIEDPREYYYRRLYTDAVRAVEAARSHPRVGAIAVAGASQGGGIALAAAALTSMQTSATALTITPPAAPPAAAPVGAVELALVDVPFMQHIRHATEITDEYPYAELAGYCRAQKDRVEQVFRTLSYFDGVNFAARCGVRALYSVALRDGITPPSTVFASYNHYAGEKEIAVYPYNGHEGGESTHTQLKVDLAKKVLG